MELLQCAITGSWLFAKIKDGEETSPQFDSEGI
jgi:hypothetical protein